VPPIGGRYQYVLLAVMSGTFGFVFFDRMILNSLIPFIKPELGLDNVAIGYLGGIPALTWALSGLLMGWLSDRADRRKPFLIAAVVLFTVFSVLSGFVGGVASLLLLRGLMGAAEGGTMPLIQPLMFHSTEPKRRGLFIGLMQGSAPGLLGGVLSPLVAVWIASEFGWRTAFFATIIPGLLLTVVILLFVKELRLKQVAVATGAFDSSDTAPAIGSHAFERVPLGKILRERNVLVSLAVGLFFQAWFAITTVFTPTFLTEVRGFSLGDMALIMSSIGVAWILWGAVVAAVSDRIGRRASMIAFATISVLAPIVIMNVNGVWVMFGLLIVTYTGLGCFTLFMTVIPAESVPPAAVGTVVGLVMGFSEVTGGFLMPIVAGYIAEATNLMVVMMLASGAALVAAVLSCFYRETAPARVSREGSGRVHTTPVESAIEATRVD
jgi:MFS family permease